MAQVSCLPSLQLVLSVSLVLIASWCPSAPADIVSDCGFEDAEAQDGTWWGTSDGAWSDIEVPYLNPWTSNDQTRTDTSKFHEGVQAVRLRAADCYILVDPAGSDGVANVHFWRTKSSGSTGDWTVLLQWSSDGSNWNTALTIPAPMGDDTWHEHSVDINQTGDIRIRWFMSQKNSGSIILDEVTITSMVAGTPTATFAPPTPSTSVGDWAVYR